jgi:fumarylacetoacetate (FAA) hydrolase
MKLASLRDGTPDGRLVVVSSDLTRASDARHIAPNLSAALEDWERAGRELDLIARGIEIGAQPVERFHEREALAPLPTALRITTESPEASPRRETGAVFADPRARLSLPGDGVASLRISLAVVTGAVAMGADREAARAAIRFVMLAAGIGSNETALSPVAITPEDFGATPPLRLHVLLNGSVAAEGAIEFDPAEVVMQASRVEAIPSGAILVAGTRPRFATIDIRPGDILTVETRDPQGRSIFGAIERRPDLDGSGD